MAGNTTGTVGIYAWCSDLEKTPGGLESFAGSLARYLVSRDLSVVVHCMAADTAGWHVREGQFRLGGEVVQLEPRLHVFHPAHGPGVAGAVAEHRAVSSQFGEAVVLALGTRDRYVFDIASAVMRQEDIPAIAFYFHTTDERRFRAQFTSRGAGVPGLASAAEHAEFDAGVVEGVRSVAASFPAVVVPTEYVYRQLADLLPSSDMAKVIVSYHGPAASTFPPRDGGWDEGGPWLHVSRLSVPNASHKNFMWSCELVRAAVASGMPLSPHAFLEVCGGGNGAGLLRRFAEQNGLTERISTVGELGQQALARRYRNAAFLLVPSMMEAGCTVIVEALLSGCAPVVLDHAANGEVMRRLGLSQLLVRPMRRRHESLLANGTPTGHTDSIEPDMSHALEILARCIEDPAGTHAALATAANVARDHFTIDPCVRDLDARLRNVGIDIGLGSASPPVPAAVNEVL